MSSVELAAVVVIVFALVLIFAFSRYGKSIRAKLKGFGATLDVAGDNVSPTATPAIKGHDLKSRRGSISANDKTGRGVDVRKADAALDISLESGGDPSPKESPRP